MRPRLLPAVVLLVLALAGCTTAPQAGTVTNPATAMEPPALPATLRGSEETSALLDNFTAFISAVDGQPVAASRAGWDTPVELKAGKHVLTVEFKRGVFSAKAQLELTAAAGAHYQLKYTTDAQLFGKNSFCDFWIVELATSQPATAVVRAAVVKGN